MATRGRKPRPTALKLIDGNPGKRRMNEDEPRPEPGDMPEPPEHLSDEALEEWERMAGVLHNLGLLYDVDRAALAAYCQVYGRWVQAEKALAVDAKNDPSRHGLVSKTSNGNLVQNPLVGTANKAAQDLMKYAAEFGMTPSARTRLSVNPGDKKKSKFAGLLGVGEGKKV